MYKDMIYQGHTIAKWVEMLHNQWSAGEIYHMCLDKVDLSKLMI